MKSQAWHRQRALEGLMAEIAHILLAGTGINHDVMFQRLPGLSYLLVACSSARKYDIFSERLVVDI